MKIIYTSQISRNKFFKSKTIRNHKALLKFNIANLSNLPKLIINLIDTNTIKFP